MIRYKSYKDALVLGSKGNSTAGCTAQQIACRQTSLLVMQQKRCPSFNVFDECFSSTPNVKPVYPQEVGSVEDSQGLPVEEQSEPDEPPATPPAALVASFAQQVTSLAAPKAAAAPPTQLVPSRAAPQAAGGGGKPAASFHLAPSKKEKKMDLGEAYLKAQQSRIESVAASARAKIRCDLVIALTVQNKTAQEITDFLLTTGF